MMEIFPASRRCYPRHRGLYALWVAVVICCGLASRAEALALPAFVAKYAGDALWALLIFLGVGFLSPTRRTRAVAGLAVVVCCAIECSQLYHAPWIDAARRTWFGRLVLGDTFAWGDIAAYLVGIVLGGVIEWAVSRAHRGDGSEPTTAADGDRARGSPDFTDLQRGRRC
jgi:hypothetical protein